MELAVLGIKIENGQINKAITSLDGLTVAGAKAEIATSRLSRRMALAEISAREMDASMGLLGKTAQRVTGAMAAFSAIAVVGFIGRETIKNTIEAQNAMAQLEAAVRSTGGVAGKTVAELDALSMSLQKQTTYSDEAVKGAEAMLLTFDKIRGANFDRATQAITDLATRMGGDLQGAAVQVGKALQDPEHGLTALRRVGVSFSEAQIVVIKNLFETGRAADGQRVILKELEHQFGGSAAAARDTLGGALSGLKNSFGDLFEVTRGGSQGVVTAINAITKALETSGLSMNTILTDALIDWETMRTSISKVAAILALPITKTFLQDARDIIHQLDEDLIHFTLKQSRPAKPGPAGKVVAIAAEQTQAEIAAAKKQHEANQDLIRDAAQAADLAGLEGPAQEKVRIAYEASNKVIDAQRRLKGALLVETIKAIEAEEQSRFAGVDRSTSMKAENDAMEKAKHDLDAFEDDLTSKLSKSLSRVFGPENPIRGLFESLTKDLLRLWLTKFVEPAAAAMFAIDIRGSMMGTGGVGGIADASMSMAPNARYGQAAAGLAGLGIGYGVGGALYSSSRGGAGNNVRGALGGAAGGALAGAALGAAIGPLGAVTGAAIGGITGLVGGILGMGSASKAAARAMAEAVKDVTLSMQSLRASVSGDSLELDIAGIEADREARRRAIEDAWSGGGADSDRVRWRTQQLAEMNRLEDERIAKLRESYALQQTYAREDLEVRKLRAQGQTREADAMARQQAADREIAQAIADHRSDEYVATLRYVTGLELATTAMDKATNSALNMVEGYNIVWEAFRASSVTSGMSGGSSVPVSPLMAPMGGTRGTPQPTEPVVMQPIVLEVDGKEMARVVKQVFKDDARRGGDGDDFNWGRGT